MPEYILGNAEERAKENPDSFLIPREIERKNIPVKSYAKLMFELPEEITVPPPPEMVGKACADCDTNPAVSPDDPFTGERMWVEVTDRNESHSYDTKKRKRHIKITYKGILRNNPVVLVQRLKYSDTIEFGPEHVCAIDHG